MQSVAFSPDGTRIATGSEDRTLRVWDAVTGRQIAVLPGHGGAVQSVSFSPDATRIVTASRDGTVRTWDARLPSRSSEDLITEACTRRLVGLSKLTRDDMRLAGAADDVPAIDICADIKE